MNDPAASCGVSTPKPTAIPCAPRGGEYNPKRFKQHPERNPQFENITALKATYLAAGQPVLSMDTKKKEMLGNFYRSGKLYTREMLEVWDHDFPSYSEGKR